jgi:RNA polymerase sigma-70 factor (family 1)
MQHPPDQVCEEQIFQQLFFEYATRIRNFIYFKSGDLPLSEDLTQEAFLRLWNNCETVSYTKARSFLFTVANNLFLDVVKHQKVVQQFQLLPKSKEHVHTPEQLLEETDMKSRLETALMALPEKQRLVFLLSRIEKMTYKEIAELLDISVKAVEKRMHKALASLRENILEQK